MIQLNINSNITVWWTDCGATATFHYVCWAVAVAGLVQLLVKIYRSRPWGSWGKPWPSYGQCMLGGWDWGCGCLGVITKTVRQARLVLPASCRMLSPISHITFLSQPLMSHNRNHWFPPYNHRLICEMRAEPSWLMLATDTSSIRNE